MRLFALGLLAVPAVLAAAASPSPAPAVGSPVPATWNVDNGHSTVLFKTKHLGLAWAYGRFDQVAGQVEYDPANPAASKVTIEVDAASVNSNDEGRDKHLRGADFFSAKEFPKITFTSTGVAPREDGKLDVTGDLAFHGVTKSVTIVVEPIGTGKGPYGKTRAGFHTTLTIDPRDYEIRYMQEKDLLGPDVELTIALEVIQG